MDTQSGTKIVDKNRAVNVINIPFMKGMIHFATYHRVVRLYGIRLMKNQPIES